MTIALEAVTVTRSGRRVLGPVTASLPAGAVTAVIGPNGAGKSTLLKAIAGLIAHGGRLTLEGAEVARMDGGRRARRIAYLPQSGDIAWPVRVRDVVALGRLPHGADPSRLTEHHAAAVERALAAADMTALAERTVDTLSGGERARTLIARALAVEAPVLVVDEPAAALDIAHRLALYAALGRHAAEGGTVVAAIHDLDDAARHAANLVVLQQGAVAAQGRPADILDDAVLAGVFGVRRVQEAAGGGWAATGPAGPIAKGSA